MRDLQGIKCVKYIFVHSCQIENQTFTFSTFPFFSLSSCFVVNVDLQMTSARKLSRREKKARKRRKRDENKMRMKVSSSSVASCI